MGFQNLKVNFVVTFNKRQTNRVSWRINQTFKEYKLNTNYEDFQLHLYFCSRKDHSTLATHLRDSVYSLRSFSKPSHLYVVCVTLCVYLFSVRAVTYYVFRSPKTLCVSNFVDFVIMLQTNNQYDKQEQNSVQIFF